MIQKSENSLNEKNEKNKTKQEHAFKGFASTCNVEILDSFNPELQFKDTEFAIKSKLRELLTQLKSFKFVTISALVFKKIRQSFYSSSKAETIIKESGIDDVFQ